MRNLALALTLSLASAFSPALNINARRMSAQAASFYDLSDTANDGSKIDFSQFKVGLAFGLMCFLSTQSKIREIIRREKSSTASTWHPREVRRSASTRPWPLSRRHSARIWQFLPSPQVVTFHVNNDLNARKYYPHISYLFLIGEFGNQELPTDAAVADFAYQKVKYTIATTGTNGITENKLKISAYKHSLSLN